MNLSKEDFKTPISKNLVTILKQLEKLEFEDDPPYDDIAKGLANIEKDHDEEERRIKMEQDLK